MFTSIEFQIGLLSGLFVFLAQCIYLRDVYLKKVSPSILSWLGWALLMGSSLVSQILSSGWDWSHSGILISTIGCTLIGLLGLQRKNYSLKKQDWVFLVIGLICVVIYLLSKNAWLTTVFAIIADLVLGIPTLSNAYKSSHLEKSNAWYLGLCAWTLSLLICFNHGMIYALFPIYLFLFSLAMILLMRAKKFPEN